jgi:anti-sigma regulatory factor (Ser/Thr protein kinase)
MARLSLEAITRKNSIKFSFKGPDARKIRAILRKLSIPDTNQTIAWSICEAINNSKEHGNANDKTKSINAYFLRYKSNLYVAVQDEGKGFIVEEEIERQDLLKARGFVKRGYGLLTAQSIFTEVYNFGDNVIYLRKYLGRLHVP